MNKNDNEIQMTQGKILPALVRFAIPLALSSELQLLFNGADIIVIGRFGSENALAAVGVDGLITGLITNLFINLAIGATVYASKLIGAGRRDNINSVVKSSMVFALLAGLFVTVFMMIFTRPILHALNTPETVMPLALDYMKFFIPGIPMIALYNFGAALLRSKGDTKRPLYFLTVAGFVNLGLNLLFVLGLKMDVAGVGLATTVAQYVSTVLMILCLVRENEEFKLDLKNLKIRANVLKQVLKIGLPSALQSFIFYFSNFVIQTAINSFGEKAMSGNAAASNIEQFVWVILGAMVQAGMTFISQNYGAQKMDRVDRITKISLAMTCGIGLVMGGIFALFSKNLMGLYTTDVEAINMGKIRVEVICGLYFVCGFMDCYSSCIRGLGWSALPSIVSVVGVCGLRLLWIFTFFRMKVFHNMFWLFMVYPMSWFATGIVLMFCYGYVRKKVGK